MAVINKANNPREFAEWIKLPAETRGDFLNFVLNKREGQNSPTQVNEIEKLNERLTKMNKYLNERFDELNLKLGRLASLQNPEYCPEPSGEANSVLEDPPF